MIYSIETRGNVLLSVLKEAGGLDYSKMHDRINGFATEIRNFLSAKGISYDDLKSALVPSITHKDIVLVFDTQHVTDVWYGLRFYENILPLLDKDSVNSFLSGDYVGGDEQQNFLRKILIDQTSKVKGHFRHSSQYFLVYINNVSDAFLARINSIYQKEENLVDILDVTYASEFKEYISYILSASFIKCGKYIIQADPDGTIASESVNTIGYPFEDFGFENKSIPGIAYGVFLHYKIERHLFGADQEDRMFSLSGISRNVAEIDDFDILVEPSKLNYLKENKTGVLKRIDILGNSPIDLANLIKEKIVNNYIFNLEFLVDHKVYKFNTLIEVKPLDSNRKRQKVLVALEYMPEKKQLRLITLY